MAAPSVQLLVGQRFGKLTTVAVSDKRQGSCRMWQCRCDCGNLCLVRSTRLWKGLSHSCGCGRGKTTHGHAKGGKLTRAYRCWADMIQRCTNTKKAVYRKYGGKGITVCDRWLHSFTAFLEDMGEPTAERREIDRYPNKTGNYEPGNCRWATRSENMRNTNRNHLVTYQGRTQCLAAWSEELHVSSSKLSARLLKLNWSVDRAFATP